MIDMLIVIPCVLVGAAIGSWLGIKVADWQNRE